jgi:hypothetical protein
MWKPERLLFVVAVLALLFVAAPAAQAQMPCSQCDPATSYCDDECYYCRGFNVDGSCTTTLYSTCAGRLGTAACLNCTPTWTETSRQYRGSYGNDDFHWTYWECTHHVVEWVTETDSSHCNTDSTYWSRSFCDDTIDHSESGSGPQECSDGSQYCDGFHSC